MGEILISWDGEKISTINHNCWFMRGGSYNTLLNMALESMSKEEKNSLNNFQEIFKLNDHGDGEYTICADKYTETTLPCYIFDHWKEAKIDDYSEMCETIKSKSSQNYKFDKLFWAGQLSHPTRRTFIEKFSSHPKMELIYHKDHWGHSSSLPQKYLSLPDHCDYRYMLDLQGAGYSGRTKLLFHTKRVLFYQERKFHEYWFWDLRPFVHYIPVAEDLSDMSEKFEWAENNPEECDKIANNAFNFALSNLKRSDAVARLKKILLKIEKGTLWEFSRKENEKQNKLGIIKLNEDGKIGGYKNFNESFWQSNQDSIHFLNGRKETTCILKKETEDIYMGSFLPNKNVTHIIKRIKF